MRILIDIDGVLTNFIGAMCNKWGVAEEKVKEQWPIGSWDFATPLVRYKRQETFKESNYITPKDAQQLFWRSIDENESFWSEMPSYPWAPWVINRVQAHTSDWRLCSAPSDCLTSTMGKIKWIKKQFGERFNKYHLTAYKEDLAGPMVLLIDDREENCEKFIEAGGKAILFPGYQNKNYRCMDNPIKYLMDQLTKIAPSFAHEACNV